jgi:hypothetical protein
MSHSGCLPPLAARTRRFRAHRSLAACRRHCHRDAQAKRVPTTRGNHRQLQRAPLSSSSSRRRPPAPSVTWTPLQDLTATLPWTTMPRQVPCELSPLRALHSDAGRSQRRCSPCRFSMRIRLAQRSLRAHACVLSDQSPSPASSTARVVAA